jgi:hypothetical protein
MIQRVSRTIVAAVAGVAIGGGAAHVAAQSPQVPSTTSGQVQPRTPYGEPEERAQAPAVPAQNPRAAAPVDLTGYWVSLVTDDWRWRMVTPPKGDYLYLPLNAEARKVADTWDPARDEAAGEACRAYGAVHVMRLPGRLHIAWQDDRTLKIDADAGTQTRIFNFAAGRPLSVVSQENPVTPANQVVQDQKIAPTWQGHSVAEWQYDGPRRRGPAPPARRGSLKVVTTRMKPGYFRKNGVPYSGDAVLTEYFTTIKEDTGDEYLIVTTMLDDPRYLASPYVRSAQFKKQKDATGWNPTPCSAR